MDWFVAAGATSLGLVVGCLVAYFVEEAPKLTARVMYSATGIFGGSAIIAIFHVLSAGAGSAREYWGYPIGLLFGFIAGSIYEYLCPPK